jgi:hypothetical protein
MQKKYAPSIVLLLVLILIGYGSAYWGNTEVATQETQEFIQDLNRVEAIDTSLTQRDMSDLSVYEAFADSIDHKWRGRNREYHARLMLEVGGPLSSGTFKEDRQYELVRKYDLSALEEPDSIPLILELELAGDVVTDIAEPNSPGAVNFTEKRKIDTGVRLHAWKRLIEAIDPNWDSSGALSAVVTPSDSLFHKIGFLRSGMDPKTIKDSSARAEYEELIRLNIENERKHYYQSHYRIWLKYFPKDAERYIIRAYSHPPFALEELRNMLDDQLPDKAAKDRIIQAVEKNMREWQK